MDYDCHTTTAFKEIYDTQHRRQTDMLCRCFKALDWQGGTVHEVVKFLCASAPVNSRRYGGKVYYTRNILCNGQIIGYWEDWASLWVEDWKLIVRGDLYRIKVQRII